MKFVAIGVAAWFVFAGASAFAQVGGPTHGPKAAVGGAVRAPVAGAAVGGPANKGPAIGASVMAKPPSASGVATKSGSTTGTTATTGLTGVGKPRH